MTSIDEETLARAAEAIDRAEVLIIGAGAGMGVDSGLPDFRGAEGFWKAYPPMKKAGLKFHDMANPRWFRDDPAVAWGFYGHRLHLYRDITPHTGFDILRQWAQTRDHAIFTSNVDGQFQKAGFSPDVVAEVHGSIHHLQCMVPCCDTIWSTDDSNVEVDLETFRAEGELPRCPSCGAYARPNILMFGDYGFVGSRSNRQLTSFSDFINSYELDTPVAVLEFGAGRAIPTVRYQCEQVANDFDAPLIRFNPRDFRGPKNTISIPLGAQEGLERIADLL